MIIKGLLYLLLVLPIILNSQDIKGKVLDDTREPLPFAAILLYQAKDSSLVATAYTDTLGVFSIPFSNKWTSSYLQVEIIGKELYSSEIFEGPKDFLEIVLLSSSVELDVVKIGQRKKTFIEVTGRGVVLNIAASPIAQGSNAKELLEKIPGAVVNQDGSVSIKGKQQILIYIDGKPTNMSLEDLMRLLESTPASDIEKLEVFETPPAKFDAAGSAGIVNFVYKKGKGLGYNGNIGINAGYGNWHKLSPWAGINYRKRKFNVFGNSWYYNKLNDHTATADMIMEENGEKSSFYNEFHRVHHPIGYGARYGVDYFLNDSVTIGYLGVYYNGEMSGWEPSTVTVTGPASQLYDYIDAIEQFRYYWHGLTHNLNLKKILRKGGSINVDLDFASRKNGNENSNLNNFFLGSTSLTPNFVDQGGQTDNLIYVGKIDYETVVFKDWGLEAGAKYSHVGTDNEFRSHVGTSELDLVENMDASNSFEYREQIYAVYGILTKKWKEQWSFDAGLRIEHTAAQGLSPTTSATFSRVYTNFFPNFSLAYRQADKFSISSSATRRIDRPNYHQLNPFRSQTNNFNFHEGNPTLQPQFTNTANLSIGIRDLWFLTFTASNTQGLMNQVIKQDEELKRQTHTTENLDNFYNYSVHLSSPFKPLKWWLVNLNTTVYYNEMESNLDWGVVGYELLSFSVNLQQQFEISKTFTAEISGFYHHDSYWNIWFVEPYYQFDAGLSKQIKSFSLNLSVRDFLNVRQGNGGVFQGNINMATTYRPESRIVMLSLSYSFGNQEVKAARRRKTGSEELQERAGD